MEVKYYYRDVLEMKEYKEILKEYLDEDTIIICIGTDRAIGDALGPLVGSFLNKKIKNIVYGTIHRPVHALNVQDVIKEIKTDYPNRRVLAIDAGISSISSIGTIILREGSVRPGAGVNKSLGSIGDFSIVGVTAYNKNSIQNTLYDTRLSFVYDMARVISVMIEEVLNDKRKAD